MLDNIYFWYKLNKKQSLMYQIMIILMEEHRKARLGKNYIGIYNGGDSLTFDENNWLKMKKNIMKYISSNYIEFFQNLEIDYLIGLFPGKNDPMCTLRKISLAGEVEDDKIEEVIFEKNLVSNTKYLIEFTITNTGYSYQYNGYRRTQDKLQRTANKFVLMTLIYYILSWIYPSSSKFYEHISKMFIFIKTITFGNKSVLLKTVFILVIWEILKYILKKIKN